MNFSGKDLRDIRGFRMRHPKRDSTYRVQCTVQMKIPLPDGGEGWVLGIKYICEATGAKYVREITNFESFEEIPRHTFWGKVHSLFFYS